MLKIRRIDKNPILVPDNTNPWESENSFNGCVLKDNGTFHMVYRAQGEMRPYANVQLPLSTIGYCKSPDGVNFSGRRQLIKPENDWERFGCEDPRITKFGDKYFIFYTSLSSFPFSPQSIKVSLALTHNLEKIEEKHPCTTFNSKAMALFPEKVNGKIAAILTAHTDNPPAKIAIAYFDREEDIWSADFWNKWHGDMENFVIPLLRSGDDHMEVGAPPVLTNEGWLLIYSYIYNYRSAPKTFAIEGVLLDRDNPQKVLGRSKPLLVPEEDYEIFGKVPDIVFPSGAVIDDDLLLIYYGAADTCTCVASVKLEELLCEILENKPEIWKSRTDIIHLTRYAGNPIISPVKEHHWENKYAFNPAAIYEGGKVHLLYRAMGDDDTSVMGYASLTDGMQVDERLDKPVYLPREGFERKTQNGNSGCEDPRITRIENKLYLCYTAFNGKDSPRVALSSIKADDFLAHKWNWEKPILISPPGIDDKDACIFPEKINGKYVFIHRFNPFIWIDYADHLVFHDRFIHGMILLKPRIHSWDSEKIGLGPPPIKTSSGWLLIYHGLSRYSRKYRLGAALLSLDNPAQVIARLDYPILEPEDELDKTGFRPDTVFSNGAVVIGDTLYVYYGAGDRVTGVATVGFTKLVNELSKHITE